MNTKFSGWRVLRPKAHKARRKRDYTFNRRKHGKKNPCTIRCPSKIKPEYFYMPTFHSQFITQQTEVSDVQNMCSPQSTQFLFGKLKKIGKLHLFPFRRSAFYTQSTKHIKVRIGLHYLSPYKQTHLCITS